MLAWGPSAPLTDEESRARCAARAAAQLSPACVLDEPAGTGGSRSPSPGMTPRSVALSSSSSRDDSPGLSVTGSRLRQRRLQMLNREEPKGGAPKASSLESVANANRGGLHRVSSGEVWTAMPPVAAVENMATAAATVHLKGAVGPGILTRLAPPGGSSGQLLVMPQSAGVAFPLEMKAMTSVKARMSSNPGAGGGPPPTRKDNREARSTWANRGAAALGLSGAHGGRSPVGLSPMGASAAAMTGTFFGSSQRAASATPGSQATLSPAGARKSLLGSHSGSHSAPAGTCIGMPADPQMRSPDQREMALPTRRCARGEGRPGRPALSDCGRQLLAM
mmetsp:Transcript_39052/g.71749  ORF Transcript_39052/g.71749 Transcript_39052/m.71749 type:complete len:335 (-) Transcript_39052:65-1069(-)